MDKIMEVRNKIEENLAAMRALLDLADSEKRDLTDEETQTYTATDAETDKLMWHLERLEKLAAQEEEMRAREEKPIIPNWKRSNKPPQEFSNIGEFMYSVAYRKDDPRLVYEEFETRAQSMGSGVEGGFALPEQFRPEILQVTPQEAVFRPRSTVIPAGDPPDAKITMPALNQTSDKNMYGGVVVAPVAEGGTKGETDLELKQVSLEPVEVAGYIVVIVPEPYEGTNLRSVTRLGR
jgi:HK97 family phage major capsid protein